MMRFPIDVYMMFTSPDNTVPNATIKLLMDRNVCEDTTLEWQFLWGAARFSVPTKLSDGRFAVSIHFEFLKIIGEQIQDSIDHTGSVPDQYINRTWSVEVSAVEGALDIQVYIQYAYIEKDNTYRLSIESI